MLAAFSRTRIASVIRRIFGVTSLRPGQQAVIDAVLAKRHTLAIMPTGAGKSLCYQVPALLLPGTTVVVSPLIALMRDQFEKLSSLGIEAAQVNSAIPTDEIRQARAKIGRRSIEFVFTTPEQLASAELQRLLAKAAVDLVVIDEAHCISQWGHDFRPAYLESLTALRTLGSPTVLALTATAPPEVAADIERQLGLGPLTIINTGVFRPNLSYQVRPVQDDADKQRHLIEIARTAEGTAIVYAATVRHVEAIATLFRQEGIPAVSYHGRMRGGDRAAAQDAFMSGQARLIVATNAFGMGIDKPDIRAVVHYDLPPSLEVYSQESGRAGRDGLPADCILLFQRGDRALQAFFMAGRYPVQSDFEALTAGVRATGAPAGVTRDELRSAVPGIAVSKLRVMLTLLKQARLVRERRGGRYEFSARLFEVSLESIAQEYDARRDRDRTKLEQVIVYAQTALCRTRLLVTALGEEVTWESCGTCDNCRGTAARSVAVAEGVA